MPGLTLFVDGTVLTLDPAVPVAEALAVRDGRIGAVGSRDAVLRLRSAEHTLVNLGGRTVVPGPRSSTTRGRPGSRSPTVCAVGPSAASAPPASGRRSRRTTPAGARRRWPASTPPSPAGGATARRWTPTRLPAEAALAAYTIEAARACGLEAEAGSLEVGKRADLVVLDGNPLAVPPEALLGLRVVTTLVAGCPVWPSAGPAPGTFPPPAALIDG